MHDWIPLANFLLNMLFIPLLALLIQIKTSIAKLETQVLDDRVRIAAQDQRMNQIDKHLETADASFLRHAERTQPNPTRER